MYNRCTMNDFDRALEQLWVDILQELLENIKNIKSRQRQTHPGFRGLLT